MSQSALLQGVLYNAEASYCENASSFGVALNLVELVDLSGCARRKTRVPFVPSMPFEGAQHYLEPFDGASVKLKMPLTGLGATAAGAVPSSDLVTFLGLMIGASANALATGGTLTGGTAVAPTTSMASGGVVGSMVRAGALGDGRFGGQFYAFSAHTGSALALYMAAAAVPTNGDLLYAGKMVYPLVASGAAFEAITTIRLRVLTSNGHYDLRGCFPLSAPVLTGLGLGETPMVEVTLGVGHVDTVSSTFPSATQPQRHAPNPVVNGSFAFQQVGTTTHARLTDLRKVDVDLGFSGMPIKGPGGNFEGQLYQACKRVPGQAHLAITLDKEATGTDTWWDRAELDPNTAPYYQALYSACCADGRAIGIYWPRLALCEAQPIQMNDDGWNRQRIKFEAQGVPAAADSLRGSPYRIAFA
jgi:hypothetical protein